MSQQINDNFNLQVAKSLDNKYIKDGITVYTSVSEANSTIIYRHRGLTTLIDTGGGAVEYWYKDGIADGNLVLKVPVASGDVTGTYPVLSLATVGTAGTYGDASHYPVVTVDTKGRVTGVTLQLSSSSLGAAGGDLSGTFPNPSVVWANGYPTYDARYVHLSGTDTIAGIKTFTGTGSPGSSGIVFQNVTSASSTVGDVSKVLTVTGSGEIVLGNIPNGGGTGAVSSVFTRTGIVVAQSGDYNASQVTNAVSTANTYADPSWIVTLSGTKVAQDSTHRFVSDTEKSTWNAKQDGDADLTTIAGLTPADNDILQRKSGVWTNRTIAQYKSDLALTKSDVGLGNVDNTSDVTKNGAAVTLTNKTISGVSNTITNLDTSSFVDGSVTYGKIQNIHSGKLLGRYSLSDGIIQEITIGSGLSLDNTTGILSSTGGGGGGGDCPDIQAVWSNNLGGVNLSATALQYTNPSNGSFGSGEANKVIIAPVSGTIKNLFVFVSGVQPASGSLVFTVRTGATLAALANSSLVLTIASSTNAGTGTIYSNTVNSVDVNAGDLISISVKNNSSSASSMSIISISLAYTN